MAFCVFKFVHLAAEYLKLGRLGSKFLHTTFLQKKVNEHNFELAYDCCSSCHGKNRTVCTQLRASFLGKFGTIHHLFDGKAKKKIWAQSVPFYKNNFSRRTRPDSLSTQDHCTTSVHQSLKVLFVWSIQAQNT